MPEVCRKELGILTKLLPKVEEALDESPSVDDVANLCDFYVSVLRGTFCPYMPTLFRLGKEPIEGTSKLESTNCLLHFETLSPC
jgi:hypothetical protein